MGSYSQLLVTMGKKSPWKRKEVSHGPFL